MNQLEQKKTAEQFAKDWSGRGYEKGETAQFWGDLLHRVLGIQDTYNVIRYEIPAPNGGFMDGYIADKGVIIEQKGSHVDLDKQEIRQGVLKTPFEQARDYAESFPMNKQPRYIIVCNFRTFRVHDREAASRPEQAKTYLEFTLEELAANPNYLGFITDAGNSRTIKEKEASIKAGELIGKLYDAFLKHYDDQNPDDLHALNVLCVRLVFCLFAEDAGLFVKDSLFNYLRDVPPALIGPSIDRLFVALDTPKDKRNRFDTDLSWAPYVNGGLFSERVPVPPFDDTLKLLLLLDLSADTDWSNISPTIFGGIFESTLNPETRRQGGMHYTSPENIHKVIDPLFLDDLRAEIRGIIEGDDVPNKKKLKLQKFHDKISTMNFLDPACGSGNFLTETYLCLRELEDDCMNEITKLDRKMTAGQISMIFDVTDADKHVSLNQFHGIEINDFACRVAKTALWIAKLQADSDGLALELEDPFPLHEVANIHCGNALRIDWNDVLPAEECNYIIGNPPFRGARWQTTEQKTEIKTVFHNSKNCGNIDYVGGWYIKAAEYAGNNSCRCAFVSTNSICQGEQVANIWVPIYDLGFRIDFAYDTFRWVNEANDQAHVFVVIVGFSKLGGRKTLFHHLGVDSEATALQPDNINAYLAAAPDVFIWGRTKPISNVPEIGIGSQPIDDGNYLFKDEEKEAFLAAEPGARRFFHRWLGSDEFINNRRRWTLWLGEATEEDLEHLPLCRERIEKVRQYRLKSDRSQTKKAAQAPNHYGTEIISKSYSVIIPEVSSERRKYIPIGFVGPDYFCSNKVRLMPEATSYHFGVLTSQFHNAWMRVVAGRLKSDYNYSNAIVFNNFVWPSPTDEQRAKIETLAQAVLDARDNHPGKSLADLYDPDKMPADLLAAHKALDKAVEEAYGVDFNGDEEKIVAHLFKLYAEATKDEKK